MPEAAQRSSVVVLVAALAFVGACSSEAPAPDPVPTAVRAPGATPNGVAAQMSRQVEDLASKNDAVAVAAIGMEESPNSRVK